MTRAEKRTIAVAAVLLLASLAALVHPWYQRSADAAMYIATARSLVDGEGYRYLGAPFLVRPPGFSLLLAPVVALRGASDFAWMNGLVGASGALGVVALFALARVRLGWPLALAVAAALWLNPGYQRLCSSVLSDVPGTAAALGCLWWASRGRRADWRSELALGLAVGLAVWLRSANLLLVPAIGLARWLEPRAAGGRPLGFAVLRAPAVALVVAAPWFVYGQLNASAQPVDQTRLAGYATAMLHEDPGDPTSRRLGVAEIAGRAPQRAVQLLAVLGSRLETGVKGGEHDPRASGSRAPGRGGAAPAGVLQLVLGALLVAALVRDAWIGRGAAAWFALGSVGVLLFYFGFQDRLALPIFALGLVALFDWIRQWAVRALGATRGSACAVALALVLLALDASPRAGWREIEADHRRMLSESAAVAPLLAADSRVAAWRGFHHAVLLERPVYSLHRAVGRLGAAEGIEAVIDRYGLDAVFLTTGGLSHVRDHLNERYGEPERSGVAELWRVRPQSGAGVDSVILRRPG